MEKLYFLIITLFFYYFFDIRTRGKKKLKRRKVIKLPDFSPVIFTMRKKAVTYYHKRHKFSFITNNVTYLKGVLKPKREIVIKHWDVNKVIAVKA